MYGVAELDRKLYVACRNSNHLLVFWVNHPQYQNLPDIILNHLKRGPNDIAACSLNRCLYIADWSSDKRCIWRFDVASGRQERLADVAHCPVALSVTGDGRVLVTTRTNGILVYQPTSTDDRPVPVVHVPDTVDARRAEYQHAVELPETFVPSSLFVDGTRLFVALVTGWWASFDDDNDAGFLVNCVHHRYAYTVLRPRGSFRMTRPHHLALDENGSRVFVADTDGNRVLVLDGRSDPVSSLRQIPGIGAPFRLWYIADMNLLIVGTILGFVYAVDVQTSSRECSTSM